MCRLPPVQVRIVSQTHSTRKARRKWCRRCSHGATDIRAPSITFFWSTSETVSRNWCVEFCNLACGQILCRNLDQTCHWLTDGLLTMDEKLKSAALEDSFHIEVFPKETLEIGQRKKLGRAIQEWCKAEQEAGIGALGGARA